MRADPSLQLGMTATVSLPATSEPRILIPAAAVVDQGQGPADWIVVEDKVVRRPIRIRQEREDGVVVDDGLVAGEIIMVVGAHKLVADQTVQPQLANSAGVHP